MNQTVAQRILMDRRVAYAIADRQLRVKEVGGTVAVLQGDPEDWPGQSLLDLVPELVGSEPALADILDGGLPRLELAWINRETSDGRTLYLTMFDLPWRDEKGRIVGLLHVVEDCTEAGILRHYTNRPEAVNPLPAAGLLKGASGCGRRAPSRPA